MEPTMEQTALMAKNWRDLIRPRMLEIEERSETYGKFSCEPLERGFGTTLGVSLRRVLLGSLQGAAISQIMVEGAVHEFTALSGVVEDVTEIILNLKETLFRVEADRTYTVRLEKRGEGAVTAGDIQLSDGIVCLNPQHRICTLAKDGKIAMDLVVTTGRHWSPADRHSDGMPAGAIAIDALYSPVRQVNFHVTPARVGQQTDYDKLTLEVWTNGAVRPDDAVAFAAKILKEQLNLFINFEEMAEPVETPRDAEAEKLNENLWRQVDDLVLSVRAMNCLNQANIKYIGELVQKTDTEMLRTKNFGRKSLKEIKDVLHQMGLHLGMKIDNWPGTSLKK